MKYVGKKPQNIGCITLSFNVSHCTFALILRLFCVLVQARFQTAVNVQHSTAQSDKPSISSPINTLNLITHDSQLSRNSYLSPLPNWQFVSCGTWERIFFPPSGGESVDGATEPAVPEAETRRTNKL